MNMEQIINFLKPNTKTLVSFTLFILIATMYNEVSRTEILDDQSSTEYRVGYPLKHTGYYSFFIDRNCSTNGECVEAYMTTFVETNWLDLLTDLAFWYLVAAAIASVASKCCCKKKKSKR